MVPTNTGIFLRDLKLHGGKQNLASKNHAFFRDNKASIWEKMPNIALYFTVL